jgi:LuxR family transcriptional regulator, maltose regulon positive regulatory protein
MSLPAKLTPPEPHAIVPRTRLFRRLDAPGGRRWNWIAAPAGAGKTTLASSWVAASRLACLWVSLDAGDADPATLFHYLSLAGRHRAGRRGVRLPPLTPEFVPGLEVFALRFFEQLFALYTRPFAIVLDNCHEVPTAAPLMQVVLGALIESLPGHGRLVCLSREHIPSTLIRWSAEPGFVGLGWEDLSFTDEEAVALAKLASPRPIFGMTACNQWLKGWVAGLQLMLRSHPGELDRLLSAATAPREQLFDYLAEEVLKHSTPERRDFLLRCAVLPDMDADAAALLTGRSDAGSVLADLYGERLFIERRSLGAGLSYRFHPLFRDFLRAHLARELGQAEVASFEARAAMLLEARGELEAATVIALQCGDTGLLARLILRQAEALFAQGRLLTLEQWICNVPESLRSMDGWLPYWFGVSVSLRDPARGRASLEQAYQRFEERRETVGAWLAVAGIIYSYFIVWGTEPGRVAHWVAVFEGLQAQNGGVIPEPIELQVISLLGHFVSHCPEHPVSRQLAVRARSLAPRLSDPVQRCTTGSIAVGFLAWQGDEIAARALADELARGRREDAPITLGSLVFDIWRGILLWAASDHERAIELLEAARTRCRSSGLIIYEWHCIAHLAMTALGMGDLERAGRLLEEIFASLTPQHINILHISRALQAQYLALCGEPVAAVAAARAVRTGSATLGDAPSSAAFVQCLLSSALLEAGVLDEAATCAATALELAGRLPSDRWMFDAEMLRAGIELERGSFEAVLVRLRSALGIAARRDFTGGLSLFEPKRTARLLALALRHGIETEQSRRLIRKCKLPAPEDSQVAALWPVRLRIRALGRFDVEIDERPLTPSQQVARKPLEVLKILIGLGPGDIGLEALQASLWPELEGDAARNACHVAIHRLRRLLADDGAIRVDQAAVSLNMTHAWVDVEAFRRLSARLQTAMAAGIRSATEAQRFSDELLHAYPGHFLPWEEQPWAVGARERLRSRFLYGAMRLSAALEQLGAAEASVNLNRHGVELDPQAETFHRGLIRGLVALDRRAEALQAYERCRALLRAGLGIDPAPETERLVRDLRNG